MKSADKSAAWDTAFPLTLRRKIVDPFYRNLIRHGRRREVESGIVWVTSKIDPAAKLVPVSLCPCPVCVSGGSRTFPRRNHWQSAKPRANGAYGILIRGVRVTTNACVRRRRVYGRRPCISARHVHISMSSRIYVFSPAHRTPSRSLPALTYWFRWPGHWGELKKSGKGHPYKIQRIAPRLREERKKKTGRRATFLGDFNRNEWRRGSSDPLVWAQRRHCSP